MPCHPDPCADSGRRRGRPPLSPGEKSVPITVNVPASRYDQLTREAIVRRIDLADLIRQRLFTNEK